MVSSETPTRRSFILRYLVGSVFNPSLMMVSTIWNSALSVEAGSGSCPVFSNNSSALTPSWMRRVASPPSSTMRSGPPPGPQSRARSVHHQYSWRVSPFQAKTAALSRAMAAAAWSWVEKMLQEHQRTSAPRAVRVSIRTAVWMVMWREPVMRAPLKGWDGPNSVRQAMRPGISTSASSISRRPKSAWERSLTLYSRPLVVFSTNRDMAARRKEEERERERERVSGGLRERSVSDEGEWRRSVGINKGWERELVSGLDLLFFLASYFLLCILGFSFHHNFLFSLFFHLNLFFFLSISYYIVNIFSKYNLNDY